MSITPVGPSSRNGILVGFRVPETAGARNDMGHFISEGVRELRHRNLVLAETLRTQVGRRMENHIMFGKRAAASSGRLVAVSVDTRNQYVDNWNVGVGVVDFLNRSTAKYWRTFEEGSLGVWRRPFIGTQLVAVYRRQGPSPHGTNLLTARGGVTFKNARGGDLFVVKQEIAPAHIYRDVYREAHLDQTGMQNARRFLDRVFNTPIKQFQPKARWYY